MDEVVGTHVQTCTRQQKWQKVATIVANMQMLVKSLSKLPNLFKALKLIMVSILAIEELQQQLILAPYPHSSNRLPPTNK